MYSIETKKRKLRDKEFITNKMNIGPSVTTISQSSPNIRIKSVTKQAVNHSTIKPTEHTSIGGISIGNKNTG